MKNIWTNILKYVNILFYRTMNAALRSKNIHRMFLLRSYILDIQQQLQIHQCKDRFQVYRSQIMPKDRSSAMFMLGETNDNAGWKRILFEIEADRKIIKTKPFAYFPSESEILFMTGSIFRVNQIVYDENHLKDVFNYIKKPIGKGETNLRVLAKILWRIGELKLAKEYFLRLLNQLSSNDPLHIDLYDDLANLTSQMQDYDMSVEWQKQLIMKGISFCLKFNSFFDIKITVYNVLLQNYPQNA